MASRFVPYASTPGRLLLQLVGDVMVVLWTFVWVTIGLAVHAAIAAIAEVGRQVRTGAEGIGGNLDAAGNRVDDVPFIGNALREPLTAAGNAARDIADAGNNLDATASWLAVVLALAVAAPPILAFVAPWLYLRIRFVTRKATALGLAATPAGQQLLALRALANRPLRRLADVDADPVNAWRRGDPVALRDLAALELRSTGVRR